MSLPKFVEKIILEFILDKFFIVDKFLKIIELKLFLLAKIFKVLTNF